LIPVVVTPSNFDRFRRLIQELAGFGLASSDRKLADELKSRPAVVKPALMACEIKKFQATGMQLLSRLATHDALDPANFAGVGPVLRASAEVTYPTLRLHLLGTAQGRINPIPFRTQQSAQRALSSATRARHRAYRR
jgi:hypothetical protein